MTEELKQYWIVKTRGANDYRWSIVLIELSASRTASSTDAVREYQSRYYDDFVEARVAPLPDIGSWDTFDYEKTLTMRRADA